MLNQLKGEFRKVEDAFLLIDAERKRKETELEKHKEERDQRGCL